jgi:uncharacterized membrane protein
VRFRDPDKMNDLVSSLLRFGVLLSSAIIVVGAVLALAKYGSSSTSNFFTYLPDRIPHGTFNVGLGGIISGLASLDPFSVIELGVMVLLATPVARVLLSVFLFAAEGDRIYVYVTATVLALLLFSILVTPLIPQFNA